MLALFTGLVLGQDPSCPCLTSFPNSVTLNANGNLDITLGGVTYEYPSTYGLGPNCSAADTGLSPYCSATTPPEWCCLLYTSPSPRDRQKSRMPSSA